MPLPKRIDLPNGCYAYEDTPNSAQILHQQVLGYFEQGLEVEAGMTIFDVGANIGLFALESLVRSAGELKIFCFEPAPNAFALMQRCLDEQFPHAEIESLNVGVSSAMDQATLYYRPHASAMSSFDAKCIFTEQDMERLASSAAVRDLPREYASQIPIWFAWIPTAIRVLLLKHRLRRVVTEVVPVVCKRTTIAHIIRQYKVARIDVLKIDVEGAEWDVLQGIGLENWPRVQAVAVEVHDVDGRLKQIEDLLVQQGFPNICIYQEEVFRGTSVFGVWATRQKRRANAE